MDELKKNLKVVMTKVERMIGLFHVIKMGPLIGQSGLSADSGYQSNVNVEEQEQFGIILAFKKTSILYTFIVPVPILIFKAYIDTR